MSAIISATGSSVTSEAASQPRWPWARSATSPSLHLFPGRVGTRGSLPHRAGALLIRR